MPRTMLCRLIAEPAPPSESNKIKVLLDYVVLPSPPRLLIGTVHIFSEMNKKSSWNSRKIKFRKKSKTFFFLTSIRVQLRLVFDSENSDSEARPSVIIILYCTVLPPESSPSSNLPSTVLY